MNILFDGQIFVLQSAGGISRYFTNLLRILNQQPGIRARALAPLYRNEHLAAAPMQFTYGIGLPTTWRVARIARLVGQLTAPTASRLLPCDLVHETYFAERPLVPRARRRVTTMYDMIHEIFMAGDPTTALKRASIDRCDHVICISHNTRRDLCRLFRLPEERTSVVHLGYQDFSDLRDGSWQGANVRPYLLHVGSRGGYKNFATLLRAFATSARLVKDFQIVCFGGGALTADERALASSLGLSPAHLVQLSGPDPLLGSVYANAVALVYPSLYEGFGLPPLEAMSAGCPVVCGRTSSLPEVVGDAALLADTGDVEALRHAIETITQDASKRSQLVGLGYDRCAQFSWHRCATETLAVYRSLG